jgi:ATP synthase protein I
MVRPPSIVPRAGFVRFFGLWETVLTAPDPDRLNALGKRLDEIQARGSAGAKPASSASGIAMRLGTELVAGLIVGGGIGWGIDRLFHTQPWGMVVFFILGAAAGIGGVVRTAQQANAGNAKDIEEKRS